MASTPWSLRWGHSTFQSTLSRQQSSRAWLEAHVIWVLLQANGSQRPLVTQQVQHVPGLPWMRPPVLAQGVELDVRLYYTAVQNLVYGFGNVPQITAESSDTPPIHCAQHVQQSVNMSVKHPAGLHCDPVQMTELRHQVQDACYNLSQDDIRHLYDLLHVRIHACDAVRGGFTVYWCECLDTLYCDMCLFGLNLSYTPTMTNCHINLQYNELVFESVALFSRQFYVHSYM